MGSQEIQQVRREQCGSSEQTDSPRVSGVYITLDFDRIQTARGDRRLHHVRQALFPRPDDQT
jgi:hypothetical protein